MTAVKSVKPSFSITRRDARFSSTVIETSRRKPSSLKPQAMHAAPASVANPRFQTAGSNAQPTSGSSGQTA